jgi:hypothetical protein
VVLVSVNFGWAWAGIGWAKPKRNSKNPKIRETMQYGKTVQRNTDCASFLFSLIKIISKSSNVTTDRRINYKSIRLAIVGITIDCCIIMFSLCDYDLSTIYSFKKFTTKFEKT